jgi:hypothetical protein
MENRFKNRMYDTDKTREFNRLSCYVQMFTEQEYTWLKNHYPEWTQENVFDEQYADARYLNLQFETASQIMHDRCKRFLETGESS